MEAKSIIFDKLEGFIKKFYTNELIKGVILFIGLGLLYFIFTLLIEYFLWLSTSGRTILFWLFIGVESFLLIRFIAFPLFKLFKLQQGINYEQASEIIGNHFSEVQDKLLNFLQLANQSQTSELLAASIEQKAASLQPIPFSNAVNFAKNKKFLPYAIVPILLLILFFVTGNSEIISKSFARVVNYETKFAPPAPFEFVVLNKSLTTQQNSDFVLQVKTQGKVMPENVAIQIGDEEYFLQSTKPGVFEYTFSKLSKDVTFSLLANGLNSKGLELESSYDVSEDLNFRGGFTYTKAEITSGANDGNQPRRQPKLMYNFIPTYKFSQSKNTLGLSFIGQTKAYAQDNNDLVMNGFVIVNGFVEFGLTKGLSLNVAGNNLLDTLAITESEEGSITENTTNIVRARPLPGRSISMTLSYKF